jgi:hypothetical protein
MGGRAFSAFAEDQDEGLRVRTYSTGRAEDGASADSADEMKDTTTVRRGGFIGDGSWKESRK